MSKTNIEFLPWDEIPTNQRRIIATSGTPTEPGHVDFEVLGESFLGETVWLPHMGTRPCVYCGAQLRESEGVWVDETDGDCCWGDPVTGDNENEPHRAVGG